MCERECSCCALLVHSERVYFPKRIRFVAELIETHLPSCSDGDEVVNAIAVQIQKIQRYEIA